MHAPVTEIHLMMQTGMLLARISTPQDVLDETPIFHAVRSADTPIFDALVSGESVRRWPSRTDAEWAARSDASRVDLVSRFRRDPLTAPIPVQVYAETWRPAPLQPGPSRSATPRHLSREHSSGAGRHRLPSTI
jgi:hypothetical protein